MFELGLIFALGCAMGQAVSMVTTRRLKILSVIVIQWYYAITSCLVTGLCIAFFQEKKFKVAFEETKWYVWLIVLVICVMNNLGQNLGTCINQRANPATVGIMSYSAIGFSFIVDVYLFNLSFTTIEVLGVSICLFFSILTAVYKDFRSKTVEPTKNLTVKILNSFK